MESAIYQFSFAQSDDLKKCLITQSLIFVCNEQNQHRCLNSWILTCEVIADISDYRLIFLCKFLRQTSCYVTFLGEDKLNSWCIIDRYCGSFCFNFITYFCLHLPSPWRCIIYPFVEPTVSFQMSSVAYYLPVVIGLQYHHLFLLHTSVYFHGFILLPLVFGPCLQVQRFLSYTDIEIWKDKKNKYEQALLIYLIRRF